MAGALKHKAEAWLESAMDRAFPGMESGHIVTLYLVIPLALGAVLGWYRAGYTAEYPLAVSLFEWTANFLVLWIAFDLGSRLIAFLFKPWPAPLWVILILGGIAGVAVSRPVRTAVRGVAADMAPEAQQDISFPAGMVWEEFVFAYASVVAMPILIWMVANYVYANGLGVPRYGYLSAKAAAGWLLQSDSEPGSAAAEADPLPPDFAKRLTVGEQAEIWALQAEDHYLRVHTDTKQELIRYRFSDAVGELKGQPGLQVHRSFWVNTKAIDSIKRSGRSYEIVLKSGLEVPVSRSYRYAVKEAGLLTKFPSRPTPLFNKDQVSESAAE